nr:MAG TPA_asm: nuclease [Bacteriophage sp.]
MCDIIILIGCDFSRNALKRQAFGSAAFLFARIMV